MFYMDDGLALLLSVAVCAVITAPMMYGLEALLERLAKADLQKVQRFDLSK